MPNHVRAVLPAKGEERLWRTFGDLHRRATGHIHARNGWTGYLSQAGAVAAVLLVPLPGVWRGIGGAVVMVGIPSPVVQEWFCRLSRPVFRAQWSGGQERFGERGREAFGTQAAQRAADRSDRQHKQDATYGCANRYLRCIIQVSSESSAISLASPKGQLLDSQLSDGRAERNLCKAERGNSKTWSGCGA